MSLFLIFYALFIVPKQKGAPVLNQRFPMPENKIGYFTVNSVDF